MSCFPCFAIKRSNIRKEQPLPVAQASDKTPTPPPPPIVRPVTNEPRPSSADEAISKKDEVANTTCQCTNVATQTFTFRELATATKNFRKECLLGEGGFGRVYKGTLQTTQKVVAIKQLDRNGLQGNKEFVVEVLMLSLLRHPNLANLVGHCADGDQRLLVYEYMPMGSLEDSLLDISEDKKPLDWVTRMKIASGVAQGLEYLHVKANPPVIYRDLKSSNILLDEKFNPRLTDFGLAKLGHSGNKMSHAASRVMGTYGYCAPEYERMGELTLKSDMYSFGVVLLELITGRRAIDTRRPNEEQNLVSWAQPIFRDPKRFAEIADPLLREDFPEKSLNQAVGIAAMCLQDEASVRPLINDVVAALSFLTIVPQEHNKPTPSSTSLPHSQPQTSSNHHNQRVLNHQSDDVCSSGHDNDEDGSEEYNNNGVNKGTTLTLDKEEDGDSSESLYGIEDEDFGDDYISKSKKRSSKSIRKGSNSIGKSNGNLSSRRRKNISSSSSSSNILGETSEDESDDGKS